MITVYVNTPTLMRTNLFKITHTYIEFEKYHFSTSDIRIISYDLVIMKTINIVFFLIFS